MNIEEAIARASTEATTAAPRYEVIVGYLSSGSFVVGFPGVIRIIVNDEHEFVFDVPEALGRHRGRFDISGAIRTGAENRVRIVVSVYDFEIILGTVKSTAEVKLRAGRATLFSESYDSDLFWRRCEETLTFSV